MRERCSRSTPTWMLLAIGSSTSTSRARSGSIGPQSFHSMTRTSWVSANTLLWLLLCACQKSAKLYMNCQHMDSHFHNWEHVVLQKQHTKYVCIDQSFDRTTMTRKLCVCDCKGSSKETQTWITSTFFFFMIMTHWSDGRVETQRYVSCATPLWTYRTSSCWTEKKTWSDTDLFMHSSEFQHPNAWEQ